MKLKLVPRLRVPRDDENFTRTILIIIIIWGCIWIVAGCAHAPTMDIAWREATIEEVKQICGTKIACAKWNVEQKWCQITTMKMDDDGLAFAAVYFQRKITDSEKAKQSFKSTMLGHETEHCFRGNFHAEETP